MRPLIDLLHILLCKKHHVYDMMKLHSRCEGSCYYYLECDVAGGETLPDHLEWEAFSEDFKLALELSSDKEALDFVKDSIKLSQEIRKLTEENGGRLDFIRGLLR
jgi:hypothetical protein